MITDEANASRTRRPALATLCHSRLSFSEARGVSAEVWKSGARSFMAFCLTLALYANLEYNTMEYYYIYMPRAIYSKEHEVIVEHLKRARLEAGLSQVDVADKLGRTQSYVSKIESAQRRFDVLQLKEFAKLYKKPLDYFVK